MTPTSLLYAYFTIGVTSLSSLGVTYSMINKLGYDASDVANVAVMSSIPWCIKPIIATISDKSRCFCGYRRRPFVCFFSLCAGVLLLLTPTYISDTATSNNFIMCLVGTSFCLCVVDVALDGSLMVLVQNESDMENSKKQGEAQGHAWAARVGGGALGAGWGGYVFENFGFETLMVLAAIFPLILSLVALDIPDGSVVRSTKDNQRLRIREYTTSSRCKVCAVTVRALLDIRLVLGAAVLVGIIPEINTSLFFYMYNNKFEPKVLSLIEVSGSLSSLASLFLYNAIRPGHKAAFGTGILLSSVAALIGSCISNDAVPWLLEAAAFESVIGSAAGILLLMPTITILGIVAANTEVEATVYSCGLSILNLSGVVSETVASAAMRSLHVSRDDINNVRIYVGFVAVLTAMTIPTACVFPSRDEAVDLVKNGRLETVPPSHPGLRRRSRKEDSLSDCSDAPLATTTVLVQSTDNAKKSAGEKFTLTCSDESDNADCV